VGGHPLGRVRPRFAGERAVEVLVVDRDVPLLGLVSRDVEDVHDHERPRDVGRFVPCGDFLAHFDAVEFVPVDRGGEADDGPVALAVDHGHWNLHWVAQVRLADLVAEVTLLAGRDFGVDPERF